MRLIKQRLVLLSVSIVASFVVFSVANQPKAFAAPATFTVTNTNDSGAGSLRQAILSANGNGNASDQDIINFNIAATGDISIQPQSTLSITQSVMVNGYTQSDSEINTAVWPQPFDGLLRVGIDNSVSGRMQITGNNVTVQGIVFSYSTDAEIYANGVTGLKIYGNYFDTTNNGLFAAKDPDISSKTVELLSTVDAKVGGALAAQRNMFGYCANSCIEASGVGTTGLEIKGNYIGVAPDGITSLDTYIYSNYTARNPAIVITDGVDGAIIGGTNTGEGNTIEHNASGAILVRDSNGLDVFGNRINYNFWANYWGFSGIMIEGSSNVTIGSAGTGRNIISGNQRDSIVIRDSIVTTNPSVDILIENNNLGVLSDGTTAFPNADGITIYGNTQDVSIVDNIIMNTTALTGITLLENAQNISILGNSIYNNAGIGINISDNGSNTITNSNDYLDSDTGANGYLNSPGYTSIEESAGNTDVVYTADLPAGDYRIEFFSNTIADPSGIGEGESLIGFDEIVSDGSGLQEYNHTLSGINHDNIALTATTIDAGATFGYGPTSEFGGAGEPFEPDSDIGISASLVNPNDIVAGETLDYQVTLTNNGPDTINLTNFNSSTPGSNNLFMAVLPAYLEYSSISGTNISCTDLGAGSASDIAFGTLFADHSDNSVVGCGYTGGPSLLTNGSTVTYHIFVNVVASGLGMSIVNFIAPTIVNDVNDSAYQDFLTSGLDLITQLGSSGLNNFTQTSDSPSVDIGITKTLTNPEDVVLGGVLNYQITVTNNGPSPFDLSRVNDPTPGQGTEIFIDILPPQLAYSGIAGPNIACLDLGPGSASLFGNLLLNHSDHSLVSCAHSASDILASGSSVTYTLSATVVDDANLDFINHILAPTPPGDPAADTINTIVTNDGEIIDSMQFESIDNYDYAFSRIADTSSTFELQNPQDVAPGASLIYDFSYTNNGPSAVSLASFDLSGINPLDTALVYFVLPPNLTYVSQSSSDLACTWLGSGSASFAPFYSNHNDHSLLICAYIGPGQLNSGESIQSEFTFVTDSAPNAFTAYGIANTTIADKIGYTEIKNVYAWDGVSLIDIIDRLLAGNSNNFVLGAYTSPVTNNPIVGSGSQSGGGSLADTGVNVNVIAPLAILILSLVGIVIVSKKSSGSSINRRRSLNKKTLPLVIIAIGSVVAFGFLISSGNETPKKVAQPEIYDSANDPEDRLKNIPKDAKSEVCDSIQSNSLSTVLGIDLQQGRVSIPTTKNSEGSVSACFYIPKDRSKGGLDSISITQRKFTEEAASTKAFSLLTKVSDKNRKMLSDTSFYNSNAKQIVLQKGIILTTISLSTGEKTISDDIVTNIVKAI